MLLFSYTYRNVCVSRMPVNTESNRCAYYLGATNFSRKLHDQLRKNGGGGGGREGGAVYSTPLFSHDKSLSSLIITRSAKYPADRRISRLASRQRSFFDARSYRSDWSKMKRLRFERLVPFVSFIKKEKKVVFTAYLSCTVLTTLASR